MRETTAALAQVTDLVALVTAPPPSLAATIHRVEVLRLQPNRVVAIAIASTGAVAKRVFDFDEPVDPGLVEWASSYLNEVLSGLGVGSRMIADRLADDELDPARGGLRRHARRRLHRSRDPRTPTPSTSTAPRGFSPRPTSTTCRAPTS